MLREPALLLPGDRFIIRMFSPVVTIGGGVIVDIGDHRYRVADNPAARLSILASGDTAARVALLVREQPYGMGLDALVERTGLAPSDIARAPVTTIGDWYIDSEWMRTARDEMVKAVTEFHRKNPLLPGVPRQDLREGAPQQVLDALLAESKELVAEGEIVRARSHKVVLKDDEQQARAKIEAAFEKAGLAVPALAEVLAQSGVEPARARSILQILLRERRLYRIGDDLVFHESAIAELKQLLAQRKGQRFAVPDFKTWTGISRKYAIPLLEFLDRETSHPPGRRPPHSSVTQSSGLQSGEARPGVWTFHGAFELPHQSLGELVLAVHVGEPHVAALIKIRQPRVVHADQAQNRRVHVVHVERRSPAGRSPKSSLEPSTCPPWMPAPAIHMLNA